MGCKDHRANHCVPSVQVYVIIPGWRRSVSLVLTVCQYVCIVYIVPEIKVYQPSNKDAFCLGVQIGKLVLVL